MEVVVAWGWDNDGEAAPACFPLMVTESAQKVLDKGDDGAEVAEATDRAFKFFCGCCATGKHFVNGFCPCSEMMRRQKSTCHPRITFCSSRPACADNLFLASISSRGIGSLGWFGRAVAWIASSAVASQLSRLSVFGMSIVNGIMSSMYMSLVPLGLISMSTINSLPTPNGMLSSKNLGAGTRCWEGEWRLDGSHESY